MKQLLPVFFVLFLGYLGFSLTLPIFPPLFLESGSGFLPGSISQSQRTVLMGILFAMYPIGQFLGAPILGRSSDRYGRRPVLLFSLLMVIPAYVGSALAVRFNYAIILYLSRFLSGLLEGNIVIAQASVADMSESEHEKRRSFGWLLSFGSSAFFIGPLISGFLADSQTVSWFSYDTPFWLAGLLSLFALLFVFLFFRETCRANKNLHVRWHDILASALLSFRSRRLRTLLGVNFLIFLATFFFLNFFSAFLFKKFLFSVSLLGMVNAYLSFFVFLTPFTFDLIARRFSTYETLLASLWLLSSSFLLFLLFPSPLALFGTLILVGLLIAVTFVYPALLISRLASEDSQGGALGANTSMQVLAEAISALVGGCAMALSFKLPILLAALSACVAACALIYYHRRWARGA